MELDTRFSDEELVKIIDEATLYMCACPGQVAAEVRRLRELFRYQQSCEAGPSNNSAVHQLIAGVAEQAHREMESCLERILAIEGWDRQSLKMPEGLRQLRQRLILGH